MTQATTVRTARESHKPPLTQEDLAAAVGVDQTYISLIERGLRTPSDDLKARLAQALGTTPSKLSFHIAQPSHTLSDGRDRTGHSGTPTTSSDESTSSVSTPGTREAV